MTAGAIETLIGKNVGLDAKKNANGTNSNNANSAGSGGANAVNAGALARQSFIQSIDGRDTVSLSNAVPEPFTAKLMEKVDAKVQKLTQQISLKKAEIAELQEDHVQRAMVAMRLMEKGSGAFSPGAWVAGMPTPSAKEMEEAYRRLTQRIVGVDEVGTKTAKDARQMRMDLLDAFRGYQWQNFADLMAS